MSGNLPMPHSILILWSFPTPDPILDSTGSCVGLDEREKKRKPSQ
jgi:hypothetical protein